MATRCSHIGFCISLSFLFFSFFFLINQERVSAYLNIYLFTEKKGEFPHISFIHNYGLLTHWFLLISFFFIFLINKERVSAYLSIYLFIGKKGEFPYISFILHYISLTLVQVDWSCPFYPC
jgi:hypothetical protein